ncbi:hypothetical protein [Corynebacterium pseudotuberculosis]|uniref:hypothetical protein n=1 Tax=Corynebacterium pseudotuberculosis TaxID=1719 RepID=UPI00059BA812|nr:hypothetical protein [Corynebacterium pseudotuberculosis]AFM06577.2 hypothetical protein CP162_01160 [Corynebacterium pseudotuberculosis Cp162]APG80932.1 Hypothetical protein CPI37_0228 [Corynebacterium pseudotuberculosis]WFP67410.1 hypothetical protein P8128_01150 [Corynebacterium pseudotuberculosis]
MAPTLFQAYDIAPTLAQNRTAYQLIRDYSDSISFLLVFFVPLALALFLLWMDRLEIKVLHPHGIPEKNNAAADITDLPRTGTAEEGSDSTDNAKNFLSSEEK